MDILGRTTAEWLIGSHRGEVPSDYGDNLDGDISGSTEHRPFVPAPAPFPPSSPTTFAPRRAQTSAPPDGREREANPADRGGSGHVRPNGHAGGSRSADRERADANGAGYGGSAAAQSVGRTVVAAAASDAVPAQPSSGVRPYHGGVAGSDPAVVVGTEPRGPLPALAEIQSFKDLWAGYCTTERENAERRAQAVVELIDRLGRDLIAAQETIDRLKGQVEQAKLLLGGVQSIAASLDSLAVSPLDDPIQNGGRDERV